jgi:hypothetical protein
MHSDGCRLDQTEDRGPSFIPLIVAALVQSVGTGPGAGLVCLLAMRAGALHQFLTGDGVRRMGPLGQVGCGGLSSSHRSETAIRVARPWPIAAARSTILSVTSIRAVAAQALQESPASSRCGW